MTPTYNPALVVLSYLIVQLASCAALTAIAWCAVLPLNGAILMREVGA
jgi:hypothetical protein